MPKSTRNSLGNTMRQLGGATLALARRELGLLSIVLLIGATLWLFLAIAGEMAEGETKGIDKLLLLALRDPANSDQPLGPAWLQEAALEITALGSTAILTLVTIAVVAWLALLRKFGAAALVAIAVIGGALLSQVLKSGFARPRPDLVPHGDFVTSLSFPSGHAMSSAVVYLTLAALLARAQPHRRLKIYLISVAIVLTLMIGVSRVYLGVHWPSDVAAGWCVGSAWALLCWVVTLWLQRRNPQITAPQ
jgi:undecaprenyl-diphosphatase